MIFLVDGFWLLIVETTFLTENMQKQVKAAAESGIS